MITIRTVMATVMTRVWWFAIRTLFGDEVTRSVSII